MLNDANKRKEVEDELANRSTLSDNGFRTVPYGTWNQVAKKYGLSREWVRRIGELNNYYISAKAEKEKTIFYCQSCNKNEVKQSNYNCADCQVVELICENCGLKFERLRAQYREDAEHVFHNYECLGAYNGKKYGFGATGIRKG